MITRKKQTAIYAVLIIALIIGAFLIANRLMAPSTTREWAGICVHSLSLNDAQLVNESGADWIRLDVSSGFGEAVKNAKAYNLSVLGILDSWMFDRSSVFTLDEWRGNVTYYVSQYADYVDAWEIWNEPANPTYPLLNLDTSSQENMSRIAEFYFSMVQVASPIIRQYDPSAKILLFGGLNLYSGTTNSNLKLDKEFASKLAAMNIEQYGDAVSIHAYPWNIQAQPVVWDTYSKSLEYYHALFTNRSLEFWVTETGQTTEHGESEQAQYLAEALGYFNGKVSRVFWYSLLDNSWEKPQTFGLVDNGTLRAGYFELQKQLTD
jgi:hypothetical protein